MPVDALQSENFFIYNFSNEICSYKQSFTKVLDCLFCTSILHVFRCNSMHAAVIYCPRRWRVAKFEFFDQQKLRLKWYVPSNHYSTSRTNLCVDWSHSCAFLCNIASLKEKPIEHEKWMFGINDGCNGLYTGRNVPQTLNRAALYFRYDFLYIQYDFLITMLWTCTIIGDFAILSCHFARTENVFNILSASAQDSPSTICLGAGTPFKKVYALLVYDLRPKDAFVPYSTEQFSKSHKNFVFVIILQNFVYLCFLLRDFAFYCIVCWLSEFILPFSLCVSSQGCCRQFFFEGTSPPKFLYSRCYLFCRAPLVSIGSN